MRCFVTYTALPKNPQTAVSNVTWESSKGYNPYSMLYRGSPVEREFPEIYYPDSVETPPNLINRRMDIRRELQEIDGLFDKLRERFGDKNNSQHF